MVERGSNKRVSEGGRSSASGMKGAASSEKESTIESGNREVWVRANVVEEASM